ncbi:MAG TPA: 7-cyano-7-deazaguanine synthase, partial [Bradyrhizobium sp.]|nr:7-cyano-7-deazaguanine synthase [Bradyrhizobium sp.]
QGHFLLPQGTTAVMPFSDGLDSRAVAGLMARELGEKFVRVRLGTKDYDGHLPGKRPFTSVPYDVNAGAKKFVESTARSRGFKFALLSGLAAHLAKAGQVIVPESGQGALGPALVVVGQAYEDYRSHPMFTSRMEKFLYALLGYTVRFQFPRLWYTKAETLKKFVEECDDGSSWKDTWSCWQQSRHSHADGKRRHCGICAACMLRRLSVHAAGLQEPREAYLWEKLDAPLFEDGAVGSVPDNKKQGRMRHYAIAGALHLDHLASLRSSTANAGMLKLSGFQLSRALGIAETEARTGLDRLLAQHETEWKSFRESLGDSSFVTQWSAAAA